MRSLRAFDAKCYVDFTLPHGPLIAKVVVGSIRLLQETCTGCSLVIINQIQPMLVRFTVPEARLSEVQRYRAGGTLKVRVTPAGAGAQPREGRIVFFDNSVDKTTGTIALKAAFDNADHALWPGQFIDVSLVLTTLEKAVVVPSQAVQTGQQGAYVFVVDAAGAAAVRPITPGAAAADRTVIEKGLVAGETVVTDGQLRLTPGATVVRKTGLSSPAPGVGAPGKPEAGAGASGTGTPTPEKSR